MSAAPRGRAGLWQALATAVGDGSLALTGVVVVDEALEPSNRYAERPHLGYLARVRGGMAGHPAAGPSSPARSAPVPPSDAGPFGDDVVDLTAYRARRRTARR